MQEPCGRGDAGEDQAVAENGTRFSMRLQLSHYSPCPCSWQADGGPDRSTG